MMKMMHKKGRVMWGNTPLDPSLFPCLSNESWVASRALNPVSKLWYTPDWAKNSTECKLKDVPHYAALFDVFRETLLPFIRQSDPRELIEDHEIHATNLCEGEKIPPHTDRVWLPDGEKEKNPAYSCLVYLTTVTGGELVIELPEGGVVVVPATVGNFVVFPSEYRHYVSKVLNGVRTSALLRVYEYRTAGVTDEKK